MSKLYKMIVGMSVVVLASGCSTYSNDFDCPIGSGMRCASISRVNKAYNRGLIDIEDHFDETLEQIEPKLQAAPTQGPIKVWIAPQVDGNGQFQTAREVTL